MDKAETNRRVKLAEKLKEELFYQHILINAMQGLMGMIADERIPEQQCYAFFERNIVGVVTIRRAERKRSGIKLYRWKEER